MFSVPQKATRRVSISRDTCRPRVVVDPGMRRSLLHGNREISIAVLASRGWDVVGKAGDRGFVLGRKPMAKRMRTKLREIKEQLMATRHDGIDGQGKWLAQVLRGWMAYYAVPMSGPAISAFRHHMIERWHGALMRRSQRRRLTWTRMKTIADRYLPFPRILHPWPEKRFLVTIQGGSPVR